MSRPVNLAEQPSHVKDGAKNKLKKKKKQQKTIKKNTRAISQGQASPKEMGGSIDANRQPQNCRKIRVIGRKL